jgi:eukaryotic-like serine/threonine-protein kinase
MPTDKAKPPASRSRVKPLRKRVWSAGRLLVLVAALAVTYGVFFLAAMRVATRAREVKVPDLQGKSVNDATAALTAVGLTLKVDQIRRADPKVAADHVLTQKPDAGTTLRRQRSVEVRLSDGTRDPYVPSVVDQLETEAESTITTDHLTVSSKAEIRSASYGPGKVIAQDPPARNRSATVALLVNRGEAEQTFVMPDLIGVEATRALDVLRPQGFRVPQPSLVSYPGLRAGIVVRQTPQAGFQIAKGELISLEVSK